VVVVAVLAVGGPYVFIHFIEGKAPAPLSLKSSASASPSSSSTVQAIFHVIVIPDLKLASSTSPATATAHTTVTTTAAVTNIGAVSRKTSITYTVSFTDASGNTSVVATDKAVVSVSPGQTASRAFSFAVKSSTPAGTYTVVVAATDETGTVSLSSSFTVS